MTLKRTDPDIYPSGWNYSHHYGEIEAPMEPNKAVGPVVFSRTLNLERL